MTEWDALVRNVIDMLHQFITPTNVAVLTHSVAEFRRQCVYRLVQAFERSLLPITNQC